MVDRDDLTEHVDRQIETAIDRGRPDPLRRRHPRRLMPLDEEVAARLRYVNKPVILVMNKADTPEIDARGRRVLQARPRQAGRRLDPAEPQQEGPAQADRRDAPRRRRRQAGRRGDEDRRRRPPQHRQVHVHQHAGPRRADDRLGARRARPATRSTSGSSSTACRSSRSTPPASSARPRSATTSTSTRSTAPSGRSAGPTSSCSSSTRPRGSRGSTSRWPTTSPSSTSRASSSSTSGT